MGEQKEIPLPVLIIALLFAGNIGAFWVVGVAGWPVWVAVAVAAAVDVLLVALGISELRKASSP